MNTEQIKRLRQLENVYKSRFKGEPEAGTAFGDAADTIERLQSRNELLVKAAKFAQAVLWGSDGDKKGAIKYLEKALAAAEINHVTTGDVRLELGMTQEECAAE